MRCRYSSASGGFELLVPSDQAVVCSAKPLRSYLLADFIKRYTKNSYYYCYYYYCYYSYLWKSVELVTSFQWPIIWDQCCLCMLNMRQLLIKVWRSQRNKMFISLVLAVKFWHQLSKSRFIYFPLSPINIINFSNFIVYTVYYRASKSETLDLSLLPCPPYEIHKMICLPSSIKILKNKLQNWETEILRNW